MADQTSGTPSYRLSSQDATFIYGESNSGPLHIGSISLFEGAMDFNAILAHFDERMHLVPRYRQRAVTVPLNLAHAVMEDDPEYALEHHIFPHDLPSDVTESDAFKTILAEYQRPLDFKRPLWELHVFNRMPGNRTALLWKIHHCLVDGVSGVELLKVMYDFRAEPENVPPPAKVWIPSAPSTPAALVGNAIRDRVISGVTRALGRWVDFNDNPRSVFENMRLMSEGMRVMQTVATRRIVQTPWNSIPVTQDRQVAWSRLPFGDFRMIRNAFGGSLNDVVLAILTEGAARYLNHHGYKTEGEALCVGCPVNVRHKDEMTSLGNRVSMMFPVAPAAPTDLVDRLRAINEETERIKAAGSAQALEYLMSMSDSVPPELMGAMSRAATAAIDAASRLAAASGWKPSPTGFTLPATGINFVATNVPGVQVAQYLNGHTCVDMVPLVPLGATLGYGVAILSYNRNMYFGMMAEPRVMPDVDLMKKFVDESFEELRSRAHAAGRAKVEKSEPLARAAD